MEAKFYGTRPSAEVLIAIAWVTSQFKIKDRLVLRIYGPDHGALKPPAGKMTAGRTLKMKPEFGGHIEVRLYLSNGLQYPHYTRHTPVLPGIMVRNMVEEIVLVLSHEMRHAVQFDTNIFNNMSEFDAEVDAECAGYAMLDKWRNNKKKSLDGKSRFSYPTL